MIKYLASSGLALAGQLGLDWLLPADMTRLWVIVWAGMVAIIWSKIHDAIWAKQEEIST